MTKHVRNIGIAVLPLFVLGVIIASTLLNKPKTQAGPKLQIPTIVRSDVSGLQIVGDDLFDPNIQHSGYEMIGGPDVRTMSVRNISNKRVLLVSVDMPKAGKKSLRDQILNLNATRESGALEPQEIVKVSRLKDQGFEITAVVYSDGTAEGQPQAVADARQFVQDFQDGARRYRKLINEKRAGTADDNKAFASVLEELARERKTTRSRGSDAMNRFLTNTITTDPKRAAFQTEQVLTRIEKGQKTN